MPNPPELEEYARLVSGAAATAQSNAGTMVLLGKVNELNDDRLWPGFVTARVNPARSMGVGPRFMNLTYSQLRSLDPTQLTRSSLMMRLLPGHEAASDAVRNAKQYKATCWHGS